MNENKNANADAPNGTDDILQPVDAALAADERIAALEEQNKKLFARTKKAEGFVQDESGNWVKKETPPAKAPISEKVEVQKPSDILRSPEFVLHREGYNEDEIDLIMRNGGRDILKDDKNPIAIGLRVAREQRIAEDASSKLGATSGQTEVERKYTPEQMRNMKKEDLANLIGFAPGQ